ncbi:MAG: hypothetical protein LBH32_13545 [Dysgonamonadaceae bacterium]|jgi:hypothetical protein|nr:hypothetical protein [Dysgonamonadaceae bacterium]
MNYELAGATFVMEIRGVKRVVIAGLREHLQNLVFCEKALRCFCSAQVKKNCSLAVLLIVQKQTRLANPRQH